MWTKLLQWNVSKLSRVILDGFNLLDSFKTLHRPQKVSRRTCHSITQFDFPTELVSQILLLAALYSNVTSNDNHTSGDDSAYECHCTMLRCDRILTFSYEATRIRCCSGLSTSVLNIILTVLNHLLTRILFWLSFIQILIPFSHVSFLYIFYPLF